MEKLHNNRFAVIFLSLFWMLAGCNKLLDIEPASQYGENFLSTKSGLNAVLNSAYRNGQFLSDYGTTRIYVPEATTDVLVNFRGLLNGNLQPVMDYNWGTSHKLIVAFWERNYRTIRDANIVVEAAPDHPDLTDTEKRQFEGEARFMRAYAYCFLYSLFGPVHIVQSPADEKFPARPTDGEMRDFIATDLTTAAELLPPTNSQIGRATKGAALGVLAEFYLNTRQWTLAASTAKQVMDLDVYDLWPDYTTLFSLENEGNSELIYVFPAVPLGPYGNTWASDALPPNYNTPNMNTATQVCIPVQFYNTFSTADKRRNLIIANYINKSGKFIDLTTGVEYQNPRSLKYGIDPNADGKEGGVDYPVIRYAQILLTRAEGLVMSSGTVSDEALNLLNQVRNRAGLNSMTSADLPGKEAFITHMLKERAWEFYSESKRRDDLLRHDLLISNAVNRGKNAKDYHVRFAIPQSEIDANENLIQNDGY
jgi:hypothetical protein